MIRSQHHEASRGCGSDVLDGWFEEPNGFRNGQVGGCRSKERAEEADHLLSTLKPNLVSQGWWDS